MIAAYWSGLSSPAITAGCLLEAAAHMSMLVLREVEHVSFHALSSRVGFCAVAWPTQMADRDPARVHNVASRKYVFLLLSKKPLKYPVRHIRSNPSPGDVVADSYE